MLKKHLNIKKNTFSIQAAKEEIICSFTVDLRLTLPWHRVINLVWDIYCNYIPFECNIMNLFTIKTMTKSLHVVKCFGSYFSRM